MQNKAKLMLFFFVVLFLVLVSIVFFITGIFLGVTEHPLWLLLCLEPLATIGLYYLGQYIYYSVSFYRTKKFIQKRDEEAKKKAAQVVP